MNDFIDIVLFGFRIGSTNHKQDDIYHPLPQSYTFNISGRCFEVTELKFKLNETENDIFYEMDFEDLLKSLKNGDNEI